MHKKNNIFFSILIAFFFFCSCDKKTELSEEDLSWIKPYKVGQEAIFESKEGIKDTVLILDKIIAHTVKFHTDKYRHESATVVYYNRKFPKHMEYQNMISMYKIYPNEPARFFFWFLLEGVQVNNYHNIPKETIYLNNELKTVYKYNTYRAKSEGDKFSPKTVYWDKDMGVVRYVAHDNVEWNLIEIREASSKDWDEDVWSRVGNIK